MHLFLIYVKKRCTPYILKMKKVLISAFSSIIIL